MDKPLRIYDKLEEEIITAFSNDQAINNLRQSIRILKDMIDKDYGNLIRKVEGLEAKIKQLRSEGK